MSSPINKILGMEENSTATSVSIQIASPEVIRAWSRGEVKNPETINYRSFKPEKGGLFCERIFGPNKDWECSCGKYKRIKHKGVVCDRCGVEVTHSRVRRERMGHIELAVPVTHVWFFKCIPSRVGLVLDLTVKNMERVIYYEDWIVTDPGETPLEYQQILTDREYREARELYGDSFIAGMGAASAQKLLSNVDLEALLEDLKVQMQSTKSKANRRKIAKRLRLTEGFIRSNTRPEWMVLDVMPVIPPDLRPLVPLEGGRFASSDLNDLYRRVINRNNRLKHLLHLRTPEVIIRNEKRMLQEAVDALLDNGRHGRPVTGTGNRPLKSLSDMLKGKSGRFRQNLLGKRVDYSGRSVIVVGPELRLGQCGLPKEMAMVLFEPFIIGQLKALGYCHTVRSAKKMIERRDPIVWDVLERVIDGHPVLLNRAPTLHRLSIQAFDPILIEGKAIRLHPLVCSAYNADFDGDQMAVHVQLSNEAQLEAKLLMMANLNIFSPADGRPITTPTQDITLGIYYMTYYPRECADDKVRHYSDVNEAFYAHENGIIHIHDMIEIPNPDYGNETCWGDAGSKTIRTTVGRIYFNEIWTEGLGYFNEAVPKKVLSNMVSDAYPIIKREGIVIMLDKLKELGYEFATRSGFSIGITDMIIPDNKSEILDAATAEVTKVRHQREEGVITNLERYNKCIDIWTQANNSLANTLYNTLKNNDGGREINPVYAMLDSGARGSRDQIRQLAGMRGLMAKPNGDIIERPILSNFREGLDVLEYFISSHGARKGLADTALKTADSGYMTRKLVDVAQDVICSQDDCGTVQGILVKPIVDGEETMLPLEDRIIGRFAAEDIKNPLKDGKFIVRANELITKDIVNVIDEMGIDQVLIRSALTCESEKGICGNCYGLSMDDVDKRVEIGSSLGIIAAQSIGEPGTQLTMRTFHLGGTASATFKKPVHEARAAGKLELVNARTVLQEDGTLVVLNKHATVVLVNDKGQEVENNKLFPGTIIYKKEGDKIKIGEKYAQWDAYNVPIITEFAGRVEYKNLVDGVTMNRVRNKKTNAMEISVLEHHGDLHPQLVLLDSEGDMIDHYSLPGGTTVSVEDGDVVKAGSTVARTPRQSAKTKDITGGLPRVAELLEARKPKEPAEIAKIDGIVELGDTSRTNKRTVIIRDPESGMEEKHLVAQGKRIVVYNGDYVRKGQPITDGAVVPHDILEVCGAQELQEYLVNEVQMVYRLQGVAINDKHVEIIVRQMLRKVKVSEAGTTKFIYGEQVDKKDFYIENERVIAEGGQPAEAEPVLLGITKASLETESFISAASFQDTTRILTDAATFGKVDTLVGFKENVIMGQLIPAGTGHDSATSFIVHKNIASPAGVEILEEESKIAEEARKEVDAIANAKALLDL